MCSWCGAIGTPTTTTESDAESMVGARAHRFGQAAFEHHVDRAKLAPRCGFAIEFNEGGHHVLPQIPERFEVVRKAHTLRDALHAVAAMNLKQRKHGIANPVGMTGFRTPQAEAGDGERPKESGDGHDDKRQSRSR